MTRQRLSRLATVRQLTASLLALALGGALALGLVACGEEDAKLLPGETAREITANLDTVKQLAEEGDCVGAEDAAQQVGEQVEAIVGIDAKLKQALSDGSERLGEVVSGCAPETEEETVEETVPDVTESTSAEPPKKEKKEKEKKPKEEPEEEIEEPEEVTPTTPTPSPTETTPTTPVTPSPTPPGGGTGAPPGGVGPEGEEG